MLPRPIVRSARALLRDREGATIVEFALVAPAFFFLLFCIVEFGLIQFSKVALESATAQVARDATLGKSSDSECSSSTDRASYIRCLFEHRTSGLINSENIYITAEVVTGNTGGVQFVPDICLTNPPRVGGSCPPGTPYEEMNGMAGFQGGQESMSVGGAGDLIEVKVFYPWKVAIPFFDRYFGNVNPDTGERSGVIMLTSSTVVKNEPF